MGTRQNGITGTLILSLQCLQREFWNAIALVKRLGKSWEKVCHEVFDRDLTVARFIDHIFVDPSSKILVAFVAICDSRRERSPKVFGLDGSRSKTVRWWGRQHLGVERNILLESLRLIYPTRRWPKSVGVANRTMGDLERCTCFGGQIYEQQHVEVPLKGMAVRNNEQRVFKKPRNPRSVLLDRPYGNVCQWPTEVAWQLLLKQLQEGI